MEKRFGDVELFKFGVIVATICLVVGFVAGFFIGDDWGWSGAMDFYDYQAICTLDNLIPYDVLRLSVDLNAEFDRGFGEGFQFAGLQAVGSVARNGWLDVSDGNATVRLIPQGACQAELEALAAECASRLEECK